MLKLIPIRKEHLLIIASILMFFISYQFSFKKTIEAWQINKRLKAQIETAGDLSVQPDYLKRKKANLDKIIGHYRVDTVSLRNNTLSTLSTVAEKEDVKLSEVPVQDPLYNTSKFIILKVSFEGDFFSLNKVFFQLQSSSNIGMLRSATYKAIKNQQSKAKDPRLMMEVYFEIIK